jgi:hypothetical protein
MTSIQEPFALSSYNTPKQASSSNSLYARLDRSSRSTEQDVVVTAQRNGVHILDVSGAHDPRFCPAECE